MTYGADSGMRLASSTFAGGGGSASASTAASVATTVISVPARPSEAVGRVSDTIVTAEPRRAGMPLHRIGKDRHERRLFERAGRDQEECAGAANENRDVQQPEVGGRGHLGHDRDVEVDPAAGEHHNRDPFE